MSARLGELHDDVFGRMRARAGNHWRIAFTVCGLFTLVLVGCLSWTVYTGIGVWGTNMPAAWAFAIINFVWWIGIGHTPMMSG